MDVPIEMGETDKFRVNGNCVQEDRKEPTKRDAWGKQIEFLFSCIAMSVGLGNMLRFPFAALKNGGGAYVIPYFTVLFLVGKPIYLLEMVIGQFYSRGCIKAFDFSPAMRGVGVGQVISIFTVATYYASLMAIGLRYFTDSFSAELPWSQCNPNWNETCIPSGETYETAIYNQSNVSSSATLYFSKEVVKSLPDINNGIGTPIPHLVILLVISWVIIFFTMIKGIKSSGKVSYILAIFPYIILIILFVRAVTLPGAINGLIVFFKPKWGEMLKPEVWFDAVAQVFFSLAVSFGCITMYASYNKFDHNLFRDVNIVSITDTCTSLLAGTTIFAILGNLQHNTGINVFAKNEEGGMGIAFMTYPDAISKLKFIPQVFSVLFFLMLFVLGIGSIVAMISCVMTVIRDKFPKVKNWQAALLVTSVGFCLGLFYVTPGGLSVLVIVDHYGASVTVFVYAIFELIAVSWIYGVRRFCKDIEFMLGTRPNLYWRVCWNYITPAIMISILVFKLSVSSKPGNYPEIAYTLGGCLSAFGLVQLPIFAIYAIVKAKGDTLLMKIKTAFKPINSWGPQNPEWYEKYIIHMNEFRSKKYRLLNTIQSCVSAGENS